MAGGDKRKPNAGAPKDDGRDGNVDIEPPQGIPGITIKGGGKTPHTRPGGGIKVPSQDGQADATSNSTQTRESPVAGGPPPGQKPAKVPFRPQQPATPEQQPQAGKPREQGIPKKREVSGIRGAADPSHHLPREIGRFQPPNQVMVDQYIKRRRVIIGVVVCLLIGGIGVALFENPQYVDRISESWDRLAEKIPSFSRRKGTSSQQAIKKDPTEKGKPKETIGAMDYELVKVAEDLCPFLKKVRIGKSKKLQMFHRARLAECFVIVNNMSNARRSLAPVRAQLRKLPEVSLNSNRSGEADALAAAVFLATTDGKGREVDALLRGRCGRISGSSTCVTRLGMLVDRRLVHSATDTFRRMQSGTRSLSRRDQARYYLFGAQLAALLNDSKTASKHYEAAFKAVPRSEVSLKKRMYESYAMFLYNNGQMSHLGRTVKKAMRDLNLLERRFLLRLRVLGQLSDPSKRKETLGAVLRRSDIASKVKKDPELVAILGLEVLRFGFEEPYLKLLTDTKLQHGRSFQNAGGAIRDVALWEIRTLIALDRHEVALNRLGSYRMSFKEDYISRHLVGVIYMRMSNNEKFQMQAAMAFQKANNRHRNWESLYALGSAMIRAGETKQLADVVKEMESFAKTPGQKYWLDLLRAESYLTTGKNKSAMMFLHRLLLKDETSFRAHELLVRVYRKTGELDKAQEVDEKLDQLRGKMRYLSTKEGISSPIGPLALARRPIE